MARHQGKVLVVGDNDMAGLTVVRSLGRAGLEVHLVAFEPNSVTRASRYVRKVYELGHPLKDPQSFTQQLLEVLRQTHFDLTIPTSDKALVPMIQHRETIEQLTHFAAPDAMGFTATNDKAETILLAQRLGIPVPRTRIIYPGEDHLPEDALPLVLKPACSINYGREKRNEVRIARTPDELREYLPALLRHGAVLVQEFCPGFGVGLNVLADKGQLVAAFQHERVHEPPQGGASSYRRSVALSQALLESARRFCAELKWTGPAMLEFKVCPNTGAAVLMEVNGRLWGSLALAVQAGVDFPRMMYELLVQGRTQPVFEYRVPFYVRHTRLDVYWLWSNFRTPKHRTDLLRKGAGEVFAELGTVCRGREGYDLESITDPVPGLLSWLRVAREGCAGIVNRLSGAWGRWCVRRQARRLWAPGSTIGERLRRARSVLFVCLGNINRSAVAEQVMRQHCAERGWDLRVTSAGLLPEAGRPSSPVARAVAGELGVDLSSHRSTPLRAELLEGHDLIVVMEADQLWRVRAMSKDAREKTFLLSSFRATAGSDDIPDPDGKSAREFRAVFESVAECVEGLVGRIEPRSQAEPEIERSASRLARRKPCHTITSCSS